jgi:eukaryotic-like serine/threonine-protein kinase
VNLATGVRIGSYEILEQLGAGAMGEVWLAEDTRLKRKVALKLLPAELTADPDRVRRFEKEAQATSALSHPNIITVFDIGECEAGRFIVMELVAGRSLRAAIAADKSLASVLTLGQQMAKALSAAHAAGITHRDIKPENIMVREDGYVKVLDFGLARLLPAATGGEEATTLAQQTTPGLLMGTVAYMSPEQARGESVSYQSDIFALGIVLYELATGQHPFKAETLVGYLRAITLQEPLPLTSWQPELPVGLNALILRMLNKDASRRPTASEVAETLLALERRDDTARSPAGEDTGDSSGIEAHRLLLKPTTAAMPEVVATASANAGTTVINKPQNRIVLAAALLSLVLLVGGYFGYRNLVSTRQIESIAVMPFVNEGGNADVEYLSDGMTETLISSLSNLSNLNVKPRSSVFRYKGKDTNPQTIAKELNVQAILNGRVVQRGQNISLFVELIDISLDKVLWSGTYNRKQTDLVTLQTDIARDVLGKIKTKLSVEDIAKVTKTYTTNPEAYQLYLKGDFYAGKFTEEGYKKGIEYYQEAIALDPNYALPYQGIAEAYDFANGWYLPPKEAEPKAKAAALRAAELDETLAETHYLLGRIAFWYEWDWTAAEREWKRANELDPTYPAYYPVYLSAMGRLEEAIKAQEVVQQRLPLDLRVKLDAAFIFMSAGRYEKSIEQSRKTLELDPRSWGAYQTLGLVYERKKQYPEAIAALEKARLLEVNPASLGYLGYVYAAAGKKAEAKKVLEELKDLSKQRYVDPYNIAIIYAGLNDKDRAFGWLDRAYEARSFNMAILTTDTVLDNLRPDPRFMEMLKQVDLPE